MPDAFDQLIRDVARLSASAVVGAVDDEENATKLAYSEFGTRTAPPRSSQCSTTLAPSPLWWLLDCGPWLPCMPHHWRIGDRSMEPRNRDPGEYVACCEGEGYA